MSVRVKADKIRRRWFFTSESWPRQDRAGLTLNPWNRLKAQLHGSQFWRQLFLKSASGNQCSNLIGCVHANYDVIVNILGVRYLENRRTRFRATAPLKALCHDIRLDCFVIASLVEKFN